MLKLLIIDDDLVDRMRIQRILSTIRSHIFDIDEATNKSDGISVLKKNSYDCVLLDLKLPDGDGISLLEEMKKCNVDIPPVIIQTVHEDEATTIKAISEGAQDYLIKGRFDSTILYNSIRHAIERYKLIKEKNRILNDLQNALNEVKTLRGLLPICSYCKQIRDDHGYWHKVENYIAMHSDAQFSHGICPDCFERHFPDFHTEKRVV
jgi:DNA-binding response OmpR family regulator